MIALSRAFLRACLVPGLSLLALACTDAADTRSAPGGDTSGGNPGGGASGDGTHDSDAHVGGGHAHDGSTEAPPGSDLPIPEDCIAYELKGLKYSPGGNVLPNMCKPFDTLTNNASAIRCIDADPTYKTGVAGDEYCILPPPPDKGFQIRIGPSDYAKPAAKYVLQPGEESNDYFPAASGNDKDVFFFNRQYRMRPGSHHLIVSKASGATGGLDVGFDAGPRLGGSQNPAKDNPELLAIPAENVGLGVALAARTDLTVNLHYINTGETPVVKEAWINFWYKEESQVKEHALEMFAAGGIAMNIAPGEHVVLGANGRYSCVVDKPGRVLSLYGHRHASTLRFSAWRKRDGKRELIYEDYDWHDPLVLEYNSVTKNPAPDLKANAGGGFSGILDLKPGDALEWECEVDNQSGGYLRFVNEALTGEMCILIGDTVGQKVSCSFP